MPVWLSKEEIGKLDSLALQELEQNGGYSVRSSPSVASSVWDAVKSTAAPIAQQAASYVAPKPQPIPQPSYDGQMAGLELEQAGQQPPYNPYQDPIAQQELAQAGPSIQAPRIGVASAAELMSGWITTPGAGQLPGLNPASIPQGQGMGISPQVGGFVNRGPDLGAIGNGAMNVLDAPRRYVGAPIAGALLDPYFTPEGRFSPTTMGANMSGGSYQDWQNQSEAIRGNLSPGLRTGYDLLTDPTLYVGPGAAKAVATKFPRIAPLLTGARNPIGSLIEGVGARNVLPFALGAGAASELTSRVDVPGVPEWAETLGGQVIGGGLAAGLAGVRRGAANVPVSSAVGDTTPNVPRAGQQIIGGAGPTSTRGAVRTAADAPSIATTGALGGTRRSTPLAGTELVPNDPLLGVRNLPPEGEGWVGRVLSKVGRQPDNAQTRPVMQEWQRANSVAITQANVVTAKARVVEGLFKWTNVKGNKLVKLTDGSAEDIRDVAARLPEFEATGRITAPQAQGIRELGAEVGRYRDLNTTLGADIGARTDVMDGGVYLPRGRPELEGLTPYKVSSGGGRRGSKPGSEKGAVYDTVRQGIDNGERYPSLTESVHDFARGEGRAAADRAAAKQLLGLTDDAGKPLAQTMVDRIDPGIRNQVIGIRQKLTSMKTTAARLDSRLATAVEDILAKPIDDFDPGVAYAALDVRVGANAVGVRGPNFGKDVQQLRGDIATLKADLKTLMPQWKKAQDAARGTPRDEGTIGIAQLSGHSFPQDIANTANRFLNNAAPTSGKGRILMAPVNAIKDITFPIRLGLDFGVMGIHGLIPMAVDKASYGRAFKASVQALFDASSQGKVIDDLNLRHAQMGFPSVTDMARNGLGITSSGVAQMGSDLGRIGETIRSLPVFRHADRQFGTFIDTWRMLAASNKLQTAKALGHDVLDDAVQRDIYKALNQVTGYGSKPIGGEWGSFLTTAPRMYQADFELLGNAIKGGGISGAIARDAVMRTVGSVLVATVAANAARGKDTEFGVEVTWEDGWLKVSFPPDWMAIKDVDGQDIKLLGRYDSLAKLFAATASADLTYALDTKMAPGLGIFVDLIQGENFLGETYNLYSDEGRKNVLKSLLPLSAQTAVEGEGWFATALNTLGIKSREASFYTQTSRDYFDETGRDYFADKKREPRKVYDWMHAHPEVQAEETKYLEEQAARGEDWADTVLDVREDRAAFNAGQEKRDEALVSSELKPEEWRDMRSSELDYLRGRTDAAWRDFHPDDDSDQDPRLIGYYDAMDKGRDELGRWDSGPLEAYMAGLPTGDQQWIEDNTGLSRELTPVEQQYRADVKVIADSGYWDVADEIAKVFAQEQGMPSSVDSQGELYDYVRGQVSQTMRDEGKDPNSLQYRGYRDEWVANNLSYFTEWLANNRAEKRNEFVDYNGQKIQIWELLTKWDYKTANEEERKYLAASGSAAEGFSK